MSGIEKIPPYLVQLDDGSRFPVNPEMLAAEGTELLHLGGNRYLLVRNGQTSTVVIQATDRKSISVSSASHGVSAIVSDHRDQLLADLGADKGHSGTERTIEAPMPGLVLKIDVKPGDAVKSGTSVLVLEAMKMENDIKSRFDGVVSAVRVRAGEPVTKGAILIEFE